MPRSATRPTLAVDIPDVWATPRTDDAEARRLASLYGHGILDTLPEQAFDDLVELASAICDTPIAAVSFIDRDRQWFKARKGLPVAETARDISFCAHAIKTQELFVVEDATADIRFNSNPFVTGDPNLRFYAGMPLLVEDGEILGTLCVVDYASRVLSETQRRALEALGRQVSAQLALRRNVQVLAAREAELARQNHTLVAMEHEKQALMALVIHDMKNPLASIVPEAEFLTEIELPPDARDSALSIQNSAARMHRMILDLLDTSSGDGRLVVSRRPLGLARFAGELTASFERRHTVMGQVATIAVVEDVTFNADPHLLRRVIENLVDNAFKYGSKRVEVTVAIDHHCIAFRVADDGPGVPREMRASVFEPTVRLARDANMRDSHGLGLAFCKLAVEAHGGSIEIEDNAPRGAVFVAKFPYGGTS